MESIYFVGIETILMGCGIYLFSEVSFLILSLIIGIYSYFIFKIKKIRYYIVPLLFIIRIFLSFSFMDLEKNQEIEFKANFVNGRGKIEKLYKKIPFETYYISVDGVPDGRYIIEGKIDKRVNNFLEVSVADKKIIEKNIFEKYFENKLGSIKNYTSNACGNFVEGIILGERRNIFLDIQENFRYSGVAHLLAISGLHIGIIILMLTNFFEKFRLRKELKNIFIFVGLTMYVLVVQTSPSIVRSYIMGVMYILSNIFYEKPDTKKSFMLAIIINLVVYPNSLGNISFLLSYISVFTILFIVPRFKIEKDIKYKNIYNFFIFLILIQIFLFPITWHFFKTISFLSFFSNLVLTPIGSFIIMISFTLFFIPDFFIKIILGDFLETMYRLLEYLLNFFRKIPYLTIKIKYDLNIEMVLLLYIIMIGYIYREEIKIFWRNNNEDDRKRSSN